MKRNATLNLTLAAMFLALGIIVPQIFHVFPVPNTGGVLLPMHIPVLLCGMVVGPVYGMIVGALCPYISSLLTGMPPMARMPFMVCELMIYGLAAGLFYKLLKKVNPYVRVYLSLIGAMICGRVAYFFTILFAINALDVKKMSTYAVVEAFVMGIPGIIIQIVIIPAVVIAINALLKRRGRRLLGVNNSFVCRNAGKRYTSDKKGIAPIMEIMEDKPSLLDGAFVADRVIGKAAALLLIKGKIATLYTDVISEHALKVLNETKIQVMYKKKVPYIVNRQGDGMCPMEETTLNINDPEEAYEALKKKLEEMRTK